MLLPGQQLLVLAILRSLPVPVPYWLATLSVSLQTLPISMSSILVSLLRVPRVVALPAIGDEIDVDVRLTGIAPDRVVGLD